MGNVYFTGNAAGFIDDCLGFGAIKAVISGLKAGFCIADSQNYNKTMEPYIKDIKAKHEFRRAVDSFSNDDYDKFISFISLPVIHQLLFNPLVNVDMGVVIAKLYNTLKNKKKSSRSR